MLPWVLSARSPEALRGQAAALAARAGELSPADVGWSLATTRSVFEHRAVVVGQDRDGLLSGLSALASGEEHPGVVRSAVVGSDPVLVFPGQGSQWAGMGAELLDSSSVFAARIAECERALSPYVDWSLTEVLRGGEMSRVDVVQPVLWAVMVSLAAVWADHGVRARRGGRPQPGGDRRRLCRGRAVPGRRGEGRGAAEPCAAAAGRWRGDGLARRRREARS